MTKRVLAFDFGASSGRAIIGCFDGDKITLEEVHRFSNDPVSVGGTVYWDVLRLFYEIKQGIIKAKIAGGFDSIGIDTWGVDFGLIDSEGKLMENPVHYRDARTVGLVDEAFKTMPKEKLYGITGIQFMELNTLFQLISLKKYRPWMLERADKMLFMPDLFGYMLTGKMCAEYSIASTSQLIDLDKKTWSKEILDAFGIKDSVFAPLVQPGTVLGELSKEVCEECGVDPVPVISVCGHDTDYCSLCRIFAAVLFSGLNIESLALEIGFDIRTAKKFFVDSESVIAFSECYCSVFRDLKLIVLFRTCTLVISDNRSDGQIFTFTVILFYNYILVFFAELLYAEIQTQLSIPELRLGLRLLFRFTDDIGNADETFYIAGIKH